MKDESISKIEFFREALFNHYLGTGKTYWSLAMYTIDQKQ